MANAMPQAVGAQFLDPDRQVVAFCGDGGLGILPGALVTVRSRRLPVKLVVFDNQRLGMQEQEQAGHQSRRTLTSDPGNRAPARIGGVNESPGCCPPRDHPAGGQSRKKRRMSEQAAGWM
ncbi:hypothetical protein DXZ75_18605 [Streptomyces sp. AcE210]|nr:hypothetical protein DXZ75_18605 [Streptomyces sp. AcE210]